MKTLVALVDFTDATAKILKQTQVLASAFGSEVVLLHVVPPQVPVAVYGAEAPLIPIDPSLATIAADKIKLDAQVQSLTQQGVNARALQLNGPVAETVLVETPRLNADLVIMGSHHHSALYHLLVGSTTDDVLKRAAFPVLVVPCDVPAPEQA